MTVESATGQLITMRCIYDDDDADDDDDSSDRSHSILCMKYVLYMVGSITLS